MFCVSKWHYIAPEGSVVFSQIKPPLQDRRKGGPAQTKQTQAKQGRTKAPTRPFFIPDDDEEEKNHATVDTESEAEQSMRVTLSHPCDRRHRVVPVAAPLLLSTPQLFFSSLQSSLACSWGTSPTILMTVSVGRASKPQNVCRSCARRSWR